MFGVRWDAARLKESDSFVRVLDLDAERHPSGKGSSDTPKFALTCLARIGK
jgi:hypothetical protein